MLALVFFLKALAAQMFVDFLPVPWKGRVGILKNRPILAGALVGAIALLLNVRFLSTWTFVACVVLSFLFGVTRSLIETSARSAEAPVARPGCPASLRAAAMKLVAAGILSLVFLMPFGGSRFAYRMPQLDLTGLGWMLLKNIPLHAWMLGYLTAMGLGSLLVAALLSNLQRQLAGGEQSEEGMRHAGRLIGFFEAFIVVTLVAVNQWPAISFLLAAKAIGRFKQMEDQRFAEYFLIGTLANVSIAIVGGMVIRLAASIR